MRLSQLGELSLLEFIRMKFPVKRSGRLARKDIIVGIGDDAAVVKPSQENSLFSTDMMVEGIHFDLRFITPYQLGFKLVSINASDIFAMGGTPRYMLLDIAANKNTEKDFIESFFQGLQDALRHYDISLLGGDISASRKDMSLAASIIGYAKNPILRSGARPGDKIYVTGYLGDSACGLELLRKAKQHVIIEKKQFRKKSTLSSYLGLGWNVLEPLLRRHLMPIARNLKSLSRYAKAMIDLSDGLLIDLTRLCAESRVGAVIYEEKIPVSGQMKKASSALGLNPLKLALTGGEDYELLFIGKFPPAHQAVKTSKNSINVTCIGEITKKGRILVDAKGRKKPFSAEGYQHFGIKR